MKTVRIADITTNDVLNGQGVCVSVWVQGCPHHCLGCHNPEAWDFNGGTEYDEDTIISEIMKLVVKNGIFRNLSILGGEPLCDKNLDFTLKLLKVAKETYPNIKTFVWSGSTYEKLVEQYGKSILENIDTLIDGPFILCQRDISLPLRGSTNQRILKLEKGEIKQ